MEYIKVGVKGSSWDEVVDYLNSGRKNTEVYCKLEKLNGICQKVHKLWRHTWFENCIVPNMDNYVKDVSNCNKKTSEPIDLEGIKEYAEMIDKDIYNLLIKLENDIKIYMQKYYSLTKAYAQADNSSFPDMFDQNSIKSYLKACLNQNVFENRKTAEDTIKIYYYLVDLQHYLMKVKRLGPNDEVDRMIKLIHYTKAQLKQIVDDLGCKIYVEHNEQNINLEKRKPKGVCRDWPYSHSPAPEYWEV